MIAHWFADHEKSTAMAIFTTGNQVGLAMAMYVTAELCKLPVLAGWPNSFILYGSHVVLSYACSAFQGSLAPCLSRFGYRWLPTGRGNRTESLPWS